MNRTANSCINFSRNKFCATCPFAKQHQVKVKSIELSSFSLDYRVAGTIIIDYKLLFELPSPHNGSMEG